MTPVSKIFPFARPHFQPCLSDPVRCGENMVTSALDISSHIWTLPSRPTPRRKSALLCVSFQTASVPFEALAASPPQSKPEEKVNVGESEAAFVRV